MPQAEWTRARLPRFAAARPNQMTPKAQEFARAWQAAWNSHDLDAIMAHYHEDVTFNSPKAALLTGASHVQGRAALRQYWALALEQQPNLQFSVCDVFEGAGLLVITYETHRNDKVAEVLKFGPTGKVVLGYACPAIRDHS